MTKPLQMSSNCQEPTASRESHFRRRRGMRVRRAAPASRRSQPGNGAASADRNDGSIRPLNGAAGRQFDRVWRNSCDPTGSCLDFSFKDTNLRNAKVIHYHAKLCAEIDHLSMWRLDSKTMTRLGHASDQLPAMQFATFRGLATVIGAALGLIVFQFRAVFGRRKSRVPLRNVMCSTSD